MTTGIHWLKQWLDSNGHSNKEISRLTASENFSFIKLVASNRQAVTSV